MTIARITARTMVCLGLAACAPQGTAEVYATEPLCPNAISEQEAVRITRELARSEIAQFSGVDIHAEWNDAVWTVFLTGKSCQNMILVDVRADGRVIDCDGDVQCEPDLGLDLPACGLTAGDFIGKDEAATIASDYLKRENLAPVPMQADSLHWFGSHWSVWVVPRGEAPLHSEFLVYVSPDGSQAELTYPLVGPTDDSFVYREPEPEQSGMRSTRQAPAIVVQHSGNPC